MISGYSTSSPKVRHTTDRLVVRLVHKGDAYRLAEYYAENRLFLKPWVRYVITATAPPTVGRYS